METYFDSFSLVRLIFQRGLAGIYLVAFVAALNQFPALLGARGLLPVPAFLERTTFRRAPSLFHWHYSDRFFRVSAWLGIALSLAALSGLSESGPLWVSMTVWLSLWFLYLSIVNVGQRFYAFGWESKLLEAGFFAAFLGPARIEPSAVPVLILRWMLFRVEIGAGLIKLRHDRCWRELTCLFHHYETQPLPNPLSWYFHRLPRVFHRSAVLFSHIVQIIVPFGLFAPQPIASIAGGLIIFHQLWLIISGNYSWLNWLAIVLGVTAFSDSVLRAFVPFGAPETVPRSQTFDVSLYLLAATVVVLSIQPVRNLFSEHQLMNYSYNPLHLVNTYGAFGSVTKERYEIVIEGTSDATPTETSTWKEYELKGKPGDPKRRPPQVAPYHLRLDWLMWFLPLRVHVTPTGILNPGYEPWFLRFIEKLLEGDDQTLALLRENPFPDEPPRLIRARFYRYQYTDFRERRETGAWWKRSAVGDYLPPIARSDLATAS